MKKFLKNPYTITIFSGVVVTVTGNAFYDHVKNVPVLSDYILKPLHIVWSAVISAITYRVPIWGIAVFIAVLILILWLIDKIQVSKIPEVTRDSTDVKPNPFTTFKEGRLKNWKWAWNYRIHHYSNKFEVIDLVPVCDSCDIKMLETQYEGHFVCPNCNKAKDIYVNPEEHPDMIKALIGHKVEKGLF